MKRQSALRASITGVINAHRVAQKQEEEKLNPLAEYGEDVELAAEHLRMFLVKACGSVLRAWIETFDANNDQRISKIEFGGGMRELGYTGEALNLFKVLDEDGSGELTLAEIDPESDRIWKKLRQFCTKHFESPEDMLRKCMDDGADTPQTARRRTLPPAAVGKVQFIVGMVRAGWPDGSEELDVIFNAMNESDGMLRSNPGLSWLAVELRRIHRKHTAKQKAKQYAALKARQVSSPTEIARHFEKFKAFLRKKHGHLIRAWRHDLTAADSMTIPKVKFLKAAAKLGFAKEAKDLWKALDKDDSGSASLDELDPKGAETLAHFQVWVKKHFGTIKDAFNAIDDDNTKWISMKEFSKAVKRFGFARPTKLLFSHLDKDGNGKLEVEDLKFLERWQPLGFLLVEPNFKAKRDFKHCIVAKMNVMKAWRHLLDKDATNRCNWYEFTDAARALGFTGDTAGAWRAFDEDLSGYISLKEVDEGASEILTNFRKWAIHEFGSVRSLFMCFDEDCSNSLSFQEFRGACRVYGYEGSTSLLFNALDVDNEGTLSMKEVEFLDDWELDSETQEEVVKEQAAERSEEEKLRKLRSMRSMRSRSSTSEMMRSRLSMSTSFTTDMEEEAMEEEVEKSIEDIDPSRIARRWQKIDHPLEMVDIARQMQVPEAWQLRQSRSSSRQERPSSQAAPQRPPSSARPSSQQVSSRQQQEPPSPQQSPLSARDRIATSGFVAQLVGITGPGQAGPAGKGRSGFLQGSQLSMDFPDIADFSADSTTAGKSVDVYQRSRHEASFVTSLQTSVRIPASYLHLGDLSTRTPEEVVPKPSLDDLLLCPHVGPAKLTAVSARSRGGRSGWCGSSRNTTITAVR